MTDTFDSPDLTEPGPAAPDDSAAPAPEVPEGEVATDFTGLLLLVGLIVALGWFASWTWALIVVAIIFMIFMHELGHYLTAKWSGMKVTEFFIGFGPRLWSFQRGETEYGVKAIPAGAYVRIIGMNNLDEVDPADEGRTYRSKSFPRRLLVAVAGSAMHFMMAIVLLFVVLNSYGVAEDDDEWVINSVSPASAAEEMGLAGGDELVSIDGEPIATFDQFGSVVASRGGDEVEVIYVRDGATRAATGVLGERLTEQGAAGIDGLVERDRVLQVDGVDVETYDDFVAEVDGRVGEPLSMIVDNNGQYSVDGVVVTELAPRREATAGFFGVSPELSPKALGPVDSATRAVTAFGDFSYQAVTGIGRFFTPSSLGDFFTGTFDFSDEPASTTAVDTTEFRDVEVRSLDASNPDENRILSIYGAAKAGVFLSADGWEQMLLFLAGLNIFVGVFNLAPFPPLDGGHVVVAIYERIRSIGGRRYQVDYGKLLPLTYAVFGILMTIGMLALFRDIIDPIDLG